MTKFLSGALVALVVLGLTLIGVKRSNPFDPDLRGASFRQSVFAAEMAKHPESQCTAFDELYVESGIKGDKQISMWHIRCSSGLVVAFIFENGKLVQAVPEGVF